MPNALMSIKGQHLYEMSCRKVFKTTFKKYRSQSRETGPIASPFNFFMRFANSTHGGKWRKGTLNRRCAQIMGVGRVDGLEKKSSKLLL